MTAQIDSLGALQDRLGVQSWPKLTKGQTFELLKLAGEQQLTTNVLGKVVELAPTFRDLAIECFETVRQSAIGMKESQSQALEIVSKAMDAFDRYVTTLLDTWKTANDPDRVAKLIEVVTKQMTEIVRIVERMNADNNRSWGDVVKMIGKWSIGLLAVGASVAAAANRRS